MILKKQFSKIPKAVKVKYGLTYKEFILNYVKSKVETFRDLNRFLKDLSGLLGKTERFNKILKILKEDKTFNNFLVYVSRKCKSDDIKILSLYFSNRLAFCKTCGKPIDKSHKFCSFKCSGSSEETKNKRKETNLKKFGVENTAFSKELKEKSKETCLKRYGSEFYFQSNDFKEKAKETCLKRYNETSFSKTEISKKKASDFMKSDYFKEKSKETCLRKYGVDNISKSDYFKKKIKDIFFKKYHDNFENFNVLYIRKHFIENNKFKIKEFSEYFKINSRSIVNKLKIYLGINEPNNDVIFTGSSKAEDGIFDFIPVENKIKKDKSILGPKEIDIFLPDYSLGIEFNGSYWHSENFKSSNYHLEKTEACEKKNIQLLHIFDFDDLEIWKSIILNKLKMNIKIPARKCEVKELKYSEVKDFLENNHLQGSVKSKINLGLFFEGNLVEVMTFSKPRFNKNYDYELLRLCTLKNFNVIGGASKLFKYFRENYKGSVVSYANRRFSNGKIYEILGFKRISESKPNYFWIKNDIVLSRYQTQKHKLKSFENYDESKSESQILSEAGFIKVFDCGNYVYELK